MDNDKILRQFEQIELRVERLLGEKNAMEAENAKLRETIARLENELQVKKEETSKYSEEKNVIRSKVDSLLAKLEDIAEAAE